MKNDLKNCCNRKSRRKPDRFALSKQYMVVTLLLYSSLQALLALGLIMYAWPSFWPEIYRALHARTSSFSFLLCNQTCHFGISRVIGSDDQHHLSFVEMVKTAKMHSLQLFLLQFLYRNTLTCDSLQMKIFKERDENRCFILLRHHHHQLDLPPLDSQFS